MIEDKTVKDFIVQYKYIVIFTIFGMIFWFGEAILHTVYLSEGGFIENVFFPCAHEFYMRSLATILFIASGLTIQALTNRWETAEIAADQARVDVNQIFEVSTPLIVIENNYNIQKVNQTFCDMFDIKMENAEGMKCYDLWNCPHYKAPECVMDQVLKSGKDSSQVMEKITRGGETKNCRINARPYRDINGNITGVVENIVDITKLKEAEGKLVTSLEEKEILLQELYHRTKNNMNSIISMMWLYNKTDDNEAINKFLTELENKIQTMSLVHEMMYSSEDLTSLDFGKYIKNLTAQLSSVYNNKSNPIQIEFDIEKLDMLIDLAIPSGLVVGELISNAYKYAYPEEEKGTIEIFLHQDAERNVTFTITDHGVGLPADLNIDNSETMGLRITKNLVEHQLKGTFDLNSENGLKCTVKFSNDLYKPRV